MIVSFARRFARIAVAFGLCLTSTNGLFAISPGDRLSSLTISHWGAQSGIPEETFAALLATADGYVWLGSNHGLVRFDGQQAEVFRLGDIFRPKGTGSCSNSSLSALLLGPDGNIWAGAASGCIFHIQQDRFGGFGNFRLAAIDVPKGPRDQHPVAALRDWPGGRSVEIVRRGMISFVDADRIPRGNTGDLQPVLQASEEKTVYRSPPGLRVLVSTRDGRGTLWAILEDGYLYKAPLHSPFPSDAAPAWERIVRWENRINAGALRMHAAHNGDIWIATTQGLQLWHDGAFRTWSTANGLPGKQVFSLLEDRAGCIWFGMDQSLGRVCNGLLETIALGSEQEERIYSLAEDQQGNIWIGGGWGNLYRASPAIFQYFTKKEGLPESHFTGVAVDRDGVVWGGMKLFGLARISGGRMIENVRDPGINESQALLADPDGGVLAGGTAGIFHVDSRGVRPFRLNPEPPNRGIVGFHWESPDRLLFANSAGVYRLHGRQVQADGETWSLQNLKGPPRIRQWATDPRGRIWALAQFDGLHYLDGDKYVPAPNASAGKARAWYNLATDHDGMLWIGTTDGLEIYSTAEQRYLTDRPLLFGDQVFHIAEDRFGKIWCATRQGLVRFSRSQALEVARHYQRTSLFYERFGEPQSIPTTNFGLVTSASGATGPDGRLWFPGLLGLVSLQPADFVRSPRPPVPVLRHVKSDTIAQDLNRPLALAPGTKSLEIRYQSIRLDTLGGDFCRVRLEGFDPDWSPCNWQRTAQYTNLAPGNYEFVVQTSSQAGVWNGKEMRVPVSMEPAIHQRLWVRLLAAALLFAGAGFFHWHRQRGLLERNRRLEERVEERTANLERAMHAAEAASRTKTQFLATMSHEIRTPMNGVLGALQILAESPLDADQHKLVSVIRQSGEDLVGIVDDILNLAKVEAGKLSLEKAAVPIAALGENLVALFRPKAESKGVAIEFLREPDVPEFIWSDPQRLRQILLNLLGNAVKFTSQGTVRLRVTADPAACKICFHVEDTGLGIPAGKIPTLFEPFVQADSSTTRRFGGSGLGLSIVRRFVDAMGGTIEVDSEPDRGSAFRVTLPFEPAPEPSQSMEMAPVATAALPAAVIGMTVLLAEDNRVNQMIFQKMLLRLGCQVVVANHGREALDALRGENIDLVLMDCQMPELDGYQTTRELRSWGGAFADLPVIALTASAMAEDRQNCFDAGMNGFLSKPLMLSSLAAALTQWGGGVAAPTAPPR